MVAANPSTVWAQLAGLVGAPGSIVFLGLDGATPVIDPGNFYWDQAAYKLYLGFGYTGTVTRYGAIEDATLINEGPLDSYVNNADVTATNVAGMSGSSSRGTATAPVLNQTGDWIARYSGKAFTDSIFQEIGAIDFYAVGADASDLGGGIFISTKSNSGTMQPAMFIGADQSLTLYGALIIAAFSVIDANFTIQNSVDATKKIKFDVSSVTTGTTRAYFVPDADGTLAILEKTQTWTVDQTFNADIKMGASNIYETEGSAIASAATCNIWTSSDGNTRHVTGAVAISSFGTAPQIGCWMKLIFDSNPLLTNSANLILPTNANLTMAAGDVMFVYADTTTIMRCVLFRADGTAIAGSPFSGGTITSPLVASATSIIEAEGADVASAATTNIWANDGNTLHITGTTTITSLGSASQAGSWKKIIFDGALTLTHSANLNLPGSANITTAAGDFAFVYADTTTQLDVLYFKKDGTPVVNSGASNLVYISKVTASASATVSFINSLAALSGTYDEFWLMCTGVVMGTDNTGVLIQVSTDGATLITTASYDYANLAWGTGGTQSGGAAGATSMLMGAGSQFGSGSTFNWNGCIKFFNPGSAALYKQTQHDISSVRTTASTTSRQSGSGTYNAATAITGFVLTPTSGNFASGVFALFGIKKS